MVTISVASETCWQGLVLYMLVTISVASETCWQSGTSVIPVHSMVTISVASETCWQSGTSVIPVHSMVTISVASETCWQSGTSVIPVHSMVTISVASETWNTLLTKTTASQNEVALSYHNVHQLCFLAVFWQFFYCEYTVYRVWFNVFIGKQQVASFNDMLIEISIYSTTENVSIVHKVKILWKSPCWCLRPFSITFEASPHFSGTFRGCAGLISLNFWCAA